jgi:hypothetical protein
MIRDIQNIEDDIIRKKRLIGELIYSDPDIIEVLDNKALDPSCPEEYIHENIFPFIRIPGIQDEAKSFITFMLDDNAAGQSNKSMKTQFLKVVIFVHKNLIKTKWGTERHDLLAYLIKDIFHLSNSLGSQLTLISDREGVTDTDYYTRTLQFEMTTPNAIQPYQTNKYERNSIVHNHDTKVQREPIR